jgi:hypothetical protein
MSECSSEQAWQEINGSGQRLLDELDSPSKVFCYPYGLRDDFGLREYQILSDSVFNYAVSALPGILKGSPSALARQDVRRWRVPRFAFDGRKGMVSRQLLF